MTSVRRVGRDFTDWSALLSLILEAFAYMAGRIDPPSSALRLTPEAVAAQVASGVVFVAEEAGQLVGSVFCEQKGDALYVGKLAVRPDRQGRGIGRALLQAAGDEARRRGLAALELQTRIELTENHAAFARLGFTKVAESAHPGYARATSITMRREVSGVQAA
jgi:GNAT superfamily N-acetyltransferase